MPEDKMVLVNKPCMTCEGTGYYEHTGVEVVCDSCSGRGNITFEEYVPLPPPINWDDIPMPDIDLSDDELNNIDFRFNLDKTKGVHYG